MIKGEKNNIDLSFEDMQFLLALYETQSLTQTAGDMRRSMGAASRRLSHVREVFGDELFVRSGLSMLPTSRMRELRDRLAELVDQTRRLLNPEPLELHEMNRVVRFISADNGIATLLSAAVERFYNAVPNSRFAIEPLDVRVLERLRANEADMAFFPATELPPDFHSLRIYRSKKGILVRDGHPVIEAYEKARRLCHRGDEGRRREECRGTQGGRGAALLPDRSLCGGEDGLYVRGAAHHPQALHDGLAVSVQDSTDA